VASHNGEGMPPVASRPGEGMPPVASRPGDPQDAFRSAARRGEKRVCPLSPNSLALSYLVIVWPLSNNSPCAALFAMAQAP
jgi:hypothetical protein